MKKLVVQAKKSSTFENMEKVENLDNMYIPFISNSDPKFREKAKMVLMYKKLDPAFYEKLMTGI